MKILDATCGGRMMWFDKKHPDVIYLDKRKENHKLPNGRTLYVQPDVKADFTCMPFNDNSFYLVVFDPPHLSKLGKTSFMNKTYGKLPVDWQPVIKAGFDECMRVLKPNGTLIFKWNENEIPVKTIIKTIGQQPLFGHPTMAGKTVWMSFIK
jgi:ubiquinone/menaquinone biosynthesis C-methylase UbiE